MTTYNGAFLDATNDAKNSHKFLNDPIAAYFWNCMMEGDNGAEDISTDDGSSWAVMYDIAEDESDLLNFVGTNVIGVILHGDSQGFVYCDTYTHGEDLLRNWDAFVDELSLEDDDYDDDDSEEEE